MAIVHFKTCNNSFEAELLKGRLASEGIPCVLQGGNTSIFNAGLGVQTAFSVNVFIDEQDMERALRMLEDDNAGEEPDDLPYEDPE